MNKRNKKPSEINDEYWVGASSKKRLEGIPENQLINKGGKWLVFEKFKDIDNAWERVKKATENHKLGFFSKSATAKPNPNANNVNVKVICVYTYDYTEIEDVFRVEKELRKLGFNQTLYYKKNSDTRKGKYKKFGDKKISTYISKSNKSFNTLSLLSLQNIREKKQQILFNIGISSVDDLMNYDTNIKLYRKGISTKEVEKLKINAISKIEQKIIKIGNPNLNIDNNEIVYFDIETDVFKNSHKNKQIWAIAVNHNNQTEVFYAEKWEQEYQILLSFLKYLSSFDNPHLFSYSCSNFDKGITLNALKRHNLDYKFFEELPHTDICTEIKKNYIFPIQTYQLKPLGEFLNYKFINNNIDGLLIAMNYGKNQLTNEKLEKKYFDYIEDDVKSLPHILHELKYKREDIIDLSIQTGEAKSNLESKKKYIISSNDFKCVYCGGKNVIKNGRTSTGKYRYKCKDCNSSFVSNFVKA